MNVLDYITRAEQRRRMEEEELLGRPLPISPLPAVQPGQPILPSKAPESYSPDTVVAPTAVPQASVAGPERFPVPQTNRTADPFRSALDIPKSVQNKARMQGFLAQLTNAAGGLGRSGRNYRADPYAAQKARSAVISDYVNRQQADVANRQRQQQLDLAQRKQELAEQPTPVDPIERALKMATLRKSMAEGSLKEREVSQAGKEDEYKAELVRVINESGKVGTNAATMAMSLKTLESMAKDVGLSELDLKKARAQGGIGGGVGGTGISREKSPIIATSLQKALVADSKFISDPDEREAYTALASKDDLSKGEARVFESIQKKAGDNKERLIKKADKWMSDFNDPEKNIGQMFEAINELKATLSRHPNVAGWNEMTSSIENLGDLGQWVIDLKNVNDPSARDVMNAIRRYKEAYARAASGAAIGQLEWTNFARQLGVGAFSNPEALRSGLDRADRVLRSAVTRSYNANVDPRLRGYSEWSDPVKPYLLPTREDADTVANKYKRGQ